MNEAFRVMLSDRPGPVSLEMCWDTMGQEWEVEVEAGNSQINLPEIDEDSLDAAADLIANSKNIMIMSGSGAQHASKEVRELSSTLGATATSLRSGRGVVSEDSDWGVSSAAAMELWESTDLLIGIGSRLEMQYMRWLSMMEYYDKPPENGPKLIRIDVDPKEMIRLKPHVGVVADAKEGVSALIEKVIKRGFNKGDLDRVKSAKVKARNDIQEIQPQLAYLDVIREVLPRDGFFVE
jgi:acetolactate synthase-1/2/3 large subunit